MATSRKTVGIIVAGLGIALILAAVVSSWASSEPDGLERVATDHGIAENAADHPLGESPLADYGVHGVESEKLSTGLAGIIGVAITFAVGLGVFLLVRGRRDPEPQPDPRGP